MENWIGSDKAISYVGIRADEANRKGYMTSKKNIMTVFPFIDDGLEIQDIESLLIEAGVGKPSYYEWRSRSGCYFCFYQRRSEWISLHDNHPELFDKAVAYEQKEQFKDTASSSAYTWTRGESLTDLLERRNSVKSFREREKASNTLLDIFSDDTEEDDFCSMCHL
jgi:hypothetical protein